MAGRGDDLLIRFRLGSAMKQADAAPGFILVEAIEGMASADAGFATSTGVEIDGKGVLFARARLVERNQGSVMAGLGRRVGIFVATGKSFDSGELLLIGK